MTVHFWKWSFVEPKPSHSVQGYIWLSILDVCFIKQVSKDWELSFLSIVLVPLVVKIWIDECGLRFNERRLKDKTIIIVIHIYFIILLNITGKYPGKSTFELNFRSERGPFTGLHGPKPIGIGPVLINWKHAYKLFILLYLWTAI